MVVSVVTNATSSRFDYFIVRLFNDDGFIMDKVEQALSIILQVQATFLDEKIAQFETQLIGANHQEDHPAHKIKSDYVELRDAVVQVAYDLEDPITIDNLN